MMAVLRPSSDLSKPESWQPRRCACGHIEAEHKSAGSGFVVTVARGICLAEGCKCREFIEKKGT